MRLNRSYLSQSEESDTISWHYTRAQRNLGGPDLGTTRQRHSQVISSEPKKYMMQKIVDHYNKEEDTLYKVRWFGYSTKDAT